MPMVPVPDHQLPEPESEGATLLRRYCTQCHALPSPGRHTADQWGVSFDRMFRRMQMMQSEKRGAWGRWMPDVSAPTGAEADELLAYLKRNALRPASRASVPESSDPQGRLFAQTCAQCHALPEPTQHTAEEWPAVVERMRTNMTLMGFGNLGEEEASDITAFLARAAGAKPSDAAPEGTEAEPSTRSQDGSDEH